MCHWSVQFFGKKLDSQRSKSHHSDINVVYLGELLKSKFDNKTGDLTTLPYLPKLLMYQKIVRNNDTLPNLENSRLPLNSKRKLIVEK